MCRHKGMHSLHPLFVICQRTNHQQQLQFSGKKEKNQNSGFTRNPKHKAQGQNTLLHLTQNLAPELSGATGLVGAKSNDDCTTSLALVKTKLLFDWKNFCICKY